MRRNPAPARQLGLPLQSEIAREVHRQVKAKKKPQRRATPRRGPGGKFVPSGGSHRKRPSRKRRGNPNRGLKTLRRARNSVRWERNKGKPRARAYTKRIFAHVNPGGDLKTWEQGAGAVAGFLSARLVGNLAPRIPLIGPHLANLGPVAGSLVAGAIGYFATRGRFRKWRAPLLVGAGLALLDAVVRRYLPAGIQGYLGEVEPYPMLPMGYGPEAAGDFNVRPALADFNVRPALAAPDTEWEGTSGYVADPGMGGYVQDGVSGWEGSGNYVTDGAAGYDDGVSGPESFMGRMMPQHQGYHPHIQWPYRQSQYRVLVECPHPIHRHQAMHPAQARLALPPPQVMALPPRTTMALPPGMVAMPPRTTIATPPVTKAKPLAGGIFSDGND